MALRYSSPSRTGSPALKKLRVTYELLDDKGEPIYSRSHDMRPSDGVPCRPMRLKANGSGLQIASHNEAIAFWRELACWGIWTITCESSTCRCLRRHWKGTRNDVYG